MSFIELTSPQGKSILVRHSSIECIYDQNDEHLHKMLTEVRLASGYSQFVKELPQYIKAEVECGITGDTHSEKRFFTLPEHKTTAAPTLPTKRTPPRKRS